MFVNIVFAAITLLLVYILIYALRALFTVNAIIRNAQRTNRWLDAHPEYEEDDPELLQLVRDSLACYEKLTDQNRWLGGMVKHHFDELKAQFP